MVYAVSLLYPNISLFSQVIALRAFVAIFSGGLGGLGLRLVHGLISGPSNKGVKTFHTEPVSLLLVEPLSLVD